MARLRTLVVAGWVVTIAGSFSVGPVVAAPTAAGVRAVAAIDTTGRADVTTELQALIDRTPDGGVVRLEPGATYRVEGTLALAERHSLRIEGSGARIVATTTAVRLRRHLQITGGSNLVVSDLEIQGANPHAGLDDRGYVPELEGQHGISLEGVTDVELDRVHIHDTYGDHVYVSRHPKDRRWSDGVWIHDSTFERSGRQGIAVVAAKDVVIERNSFADMRRATVDLEPNGQGWGAENVHILDNTVGRGRLLFVAAGGGGPVNQVVIARNQLRGRPMNFWVTPPENQRRQRFWIVDNASDTAAATAPLRFTRADGVMVHGNRQPIRGVGEPLANATDSCDVAVMANDTAPGTLALGGQSRQCSFTLPVEPPAPPSVAGRGRPRAAPPATAPPPPTTAPAPPTTASTTTEAAPSTSARSSTTDAEPLGTRLAASDTSDDDGVSVPELALAAVLTALACAGGVLAFSARRGRR
jgi:Right handed beta helix region